MASAVQEMLPLQEATKAPAVAPADVKRLVDILREHKAWITRRELAPLFGGGDKADRMIRAIAEVAAPVVVSFPGSPGYRLWDFCTIEELNRCIETFESSGRKQLQRGHVYRMALHRRFRTTRTVDSALDLCLT